MKNTESMSITFMIEEVLFSIDHNNGKFDFTFYRHLFKD